MPYVPPHIRRAAAEAGVSVEEYMAAKAAANAAEAAARAPRNVGAVARYEPGGGGGAGAAAAAARHHTSSSDRRRKARRVTVGSRRLRVNLNTGLGIDEEHGAAVEPNAYYNTRGASYRVTRRSPAINVANAAAVNAYAQRTRRKTLAGVMANRGNANAAGVSAEKLTAINAALADLADRASLNASNAMAIAAIGEQLRALMEASSSE